MNFDVEQTFLSRKIWRFSMHVKHKSLVFVVEKKLPNKQLHVQNRH